MINDCCGDPVGKADKPLISIIVVSYQAEDYLHQCVDSLLLQTYQNIEVILVDDGSTDASPEICDAYAETDSRVKVVHKANGGIVSARKAGLEAATGSFVGYVDGDDWVERDAYELMFSDAVTHGADVVTCGYKEELGGTVTETILNALPEGVYSGAKLENEFYAGMLLNGTWNKFGIHTFVWSKLFRRSILYDHQMAVDDRIHIGEDAACLYPTLLASSVVYISAHSPYHYRQHPNSSVKTSEDAENDLVKLQVLHQFLETVFGKSIYAETLLPQLKTFILSLLAVRCATVKNIDGGGFEVFPFAPLTRERRVVLYGAGTFGQHLHRRLRAIKEVKLIAWVDDMASLYRDLSLPVCPPEKLMELYFDCVFVAFLDELVANRIALQLQAQGVPEKKIMVINQPDKVATRRLTEFGVE